LLAVASHIGVRVSCDLPKTVGALTQFKRRIKKRKKTTKKTD